MTSTANTICGTGTNDTGVGTVAWATPSNITLDNTDDASLSIDDTEVSNYLTGTNFGFSIPTGATIDGLVFEMTHFGNPPDCILDDTLKIYNGTALVGDNKSSATAWIFGDDTVIYGSSTDDWNASLTVSQINSSGFGVYLSVLCDSKLGTTMAYVNYFKLIIYYTESGGGSSSQSRVMFIGI